MELIFYSVQAIGLTGQEKIINGCKREELYLRNGDNENIK